MGVIKRFPLLSNQTRHERSHVSNRPYMCQHVGCDKMFIQLGNLMTHERTHTGERPYTCKHVGCDKKFAQLSSQKCMNAHIHVKYRIRTSTVSVTEHSHIQVIKQYMNICMRMSYPVHIHRLLGRDEVFVQLSSLSF